MMFDIDDEEMWEEFDLAMVIDFSDLISAEALSFI
jgi:hypothetical protein